MGAVNGKSTVTATPVIVTPTYDPLEGQRQHPPSIPCSIKIEYMNEGAANIVYIFSLAKPKAGESALDAFWNGKLLRLRKKLPTTSLCEVAQANHDAFIKPLFRDCDLVCQRLVEIKSSGIVQALNQELKKWEMMPWEFHGPSKVLGRPTKRQGTYLADDCHGLLVQDMSPGPGQELYEFKPKWLTQSLAAPQYSKRCRSCAKRARSNALQARAGEPSSFPASSDSSFCPLDLASKRDPVLFRIGKAILHLGDRKDPLTPAQSATLSRLVDWIKKSPLLAQLKHLQTSLDRRGVFAADPTDIGFLTAMTLRDCTVYLLISPDDVTAPVTARIGDLDLKSPMKAAYWRAVEQPLIDEGWYMGTEDEDHRQPLECALFPEA